MGGVTCKVCGAEYDDERDALLIFEQSASFVCADCPAEGKGSMEQPEHPGARFLDRARCGGGGKPG
jgi:hypothetical protein